MTDNSIGHCDPELQAKIPALKQAWLGAELDIRITETFRAPDREDQLHAEGITKATSKSCEHCHMIDGKPASRAFDFAAFRGGSYITDGRDEAYTRAGEIAESLGLVWGARFKNPDWDHIELPSQQSISSTN